MELDALWENIFSKDALRVHQAWNSLDSTEQQTVRSLLHRIVEDNERAEVQRVAARFALSSTSPTLPDGALAFARELAHDTGQLLLKTYGQLTASLKRDGTMVTESDLESDRRLSDAIKQRYPTHVVLSEERDRIYRGQEWSWVIDPIDGTTNFTWGFPMWGVLIALLHWGMPILGVGISPSLASNTPPHAGKVHG